MDMIRSQSENFSASFSEASISFLLGLVVEKVR